MLNHLQIRNFAIIPTLDLDIREGFTAITGETGAGKSILVDALGLLLGERSDAGWVRPGAERAELSAEFSVEEHSEAGKWLEDSELAADGSCLLRRTINANGRSRAFINGSPVTVAQIQALGNLLVEIHGQNEHLRLTRTGEQFKLLDGSGSYLDEIAKVKNCHAKWRQIAGELESLEREASLSETELEFLNFQLAELHQHDLSAESITALQTEHDRLAAGGALLDALTASIGLLEPESAAGGTGANADLHEALGRLQQFKTLDTDIGEACTMLEEAVVNCQEALNALQDARERVDLNPSRFDSVAKNLSELHDLARKHRVPMEGLDEVMHTLQARLERASGSQQYRKQLTEKLDACLADYREFAQKLHLKRKQHASEISDRVIGLMGELGMAGGIFELAVTRNPQAPPSSRGDDDIEINISANPGLPAGPLNKIASGGELSRISLAIKVATTNGDKSVTQIFDEVDAGVGGDTANAVGRLIQRLSRRGESGSGQALCVTHLAQVAVCATHQLQVRKEPGKDSAFVGTSLLNETERVDEIARMLSGTLSEQSRAHASELLAAANINQQG